MKVILSSQYCHDLTPQALKQLDYALIFRSFNQEKLQKLHRDLDLAIDYPLFQRVYEFATTPKWSFLYIDVRNEEYRRKFADKILLSSKNKFMST